MVIQTRGRQFLAVLLGAGILLLLGAILLGPTGRDDVYKTLWPAHTFSETGNILNYNGEKLEQSSSLLHVLLLGALHRVVGGELPFLNLVFVLVCGLLAQALALNLLQKLGIEVRWTFGLLVGLQPIMMYWAWGGLDGALAAFILLVWIGAVAGLLQMDGVDWKQWGKVAGAGLLVAMVRPEAWMVALVGLGIAWAILRKSAGGISSRKWLGLFGVLLVSAGLVAAWRFWFTGGWLPQSAMAKASVLAPVRWIAGCKYLVWLLIRHPELLVPAVGVLAWMIQALKRKTLSPGIALLLGLVLSGLAFIALSGGDWMENGRFFVPYLFPAMILAWAWLEGRGRSWTRGVAAGWGVLSILGLFLMARSQNTGYPLWFDAGKSIEVENECLKAWASRENIAEPLIDGQFHPIESQNRIHLRDISPAKALVWATDLVFERKKQPVVVLSQQAGMVPYHLGLARSGKFRFIDLVGLCTRDFTDCPVTSGRGNLSGGLNMDLCYLFSDWERIEDGCAVPKPDIVFSLADEAAGLEACVESAGYQVVYRQFGALPAGPSWLSGMALDAGEFIAVRKEWVSPIEMP
ncbi:MAG: hypothetical protein U0176_02300 [Bacteroidia bacterium]